MTTGEMVIGGLVAAGVLGVGAYLIYQHNQTAAAASPASLNAGLIAANAASGQAPLPGGSGAPTAGQIAQLQGGGPDAVSSPG
jgi:uncharacterized membrane protein YebE (DUF533 family)